MHKGLLLTFTLLLSVLGYGQTISGLITDEENNILDIQWFDLCKLLNNVS